MSRRTFIAGILAAGVMPTCGVTMPCFLAQGVRELVTYDLDFGDTLYRADTIVWPGTPKEKWFHVVAIVERGTFESRRQVALDTLEAALRRYGCPPIMAPPTPVGLYHPDWWLHG